MCPPDGLTERQPHNLFDRGTTSPAQTSPDPLRRGAAVQLSRFRPAPVPASLYRRVTGTAVPRERPPAAEPPEAGEGSGALEDLLRHDLLAKLAELGPGMAQPHCEAVATCAHEALAAELRNARNQLARAIPDLLRDTPEAPCSAILATCEDAELPAAEPLLRLLPLLTVEDILALIAAPAIPGGRLVAARAAPSGHDATTLGQAAATATARTLLASEATAVREATLDVLIAGEGSQAEFAAPLVQCPALPLRVARALAGLALRQVMDLLEDCAELTATLRRTVRSRLQDRIAGQISQPLLEPSSDEAVQTAHRLKRAGALCQAVVAAAARRGEARLVGALLSVAAGVPISAVNRAVALRSTKGLVSLIWRAGFGMGIAGAVQSLLARVPPDATLAADVHGDFPITVEEMRWQIEFLTRVSR